MADQPERVQLETPDIAAGNRDVLEEAFPGLLADGVLDAARLGGLLGVEVAGLKDGPERYGLMWAGKQEAVQSLLTPSRGALVPDLERSTDFEHGEHVFVEGDNLEVLKLMQKAYNDRVKLICIDPPYNTGNDFVYHDDFRDGLRPYLELTGQVGEEGRRLRAEVDRAGRVHSAWLRMMYPRLILARNLLRQDGLIFVFIDDNEAHNLRHLMDEIFGPENFLANVVWNHTKQSKNDEPYFSRQHNSILVYRRSSELSRIRMSRSEEHNKAYKNPDDDPNGRWRSGDVRSPSPRPSLRYDIVTPSGKRIPPPDNGWRWAEDTVKEKIASGEIVFSDDETKIIRKIYLKDQEGRTPENLWDTAEVGGTREAAQEIKEIFGTMVFDTPKPTRVLRRILDLATDPHGHDLVLDFFAGSGSMAAAVLKQNAEDGGNRRFIAVNLPEPVGEDSAAAAAGFGHVSEITFARIQHVMKDVGDGGLRVFQLSESCFNAPATTADTTLPLDPHTIRLPDLIGPAVAAEVFLAEGIPLHTEWAHPDGVTDVVAAGHVAVLLTKEPTEGLVAEVLDSGAQVVVFLEDGFARRDALKADTFFNCQQRGITMKTV